MNKRSKYFCKRFRKFALDVILFVDGLKKHHHYTIISQTVRSATSVAANFYESRFSRSRKELIGILGVSLQEAKETEFWLELINDLDLLSRNKSSELRKEINEIIRILFANIEENKKKLE